MANPNPLHPRGEAHWYAKLTAKEVRAIRMRYANGESMEALAELFRITRQNVGLIVRRQSWRHVE